MNMKMMINYLGWSLVGILLVACDKNDTVGPEYTENLYRVKEISGHNAIWGNFKMSLQYENYKFEKGIVVNSQSDTVGKLDRMEDLRRKLDVFRVSVKVPALTPGEIAALPAGSAVPTTWLNVYELDRDLKKEIISGYEYKNNEFKALPERTYLYEYEDSLAVNPKVLKWRGYENQDDRGGLKRMTYSYDGDRIIAGEYAVYQAGWEITSYYTYGYQDGCLVSLVGKTTGGQMILDKKNVREGTRLKVTTVTEGTTGEVIYTLNPEGYVTRIDEGNGNYMDMKYENGHGDFSYFIPLADKLEGEPYIK